jgi:hypothetical protein
MAMAASCDTYPAAALDMVQTEMDNRRTQLNEQKQEAT